MRRFTMYRRGKLTSRHSDLHKNAPNEPQFEGVVFSDGRCALRWLTPIRSVSVWDCLEDALAIHGHPEYESELVWHDEAERKDETAELIEALRAIADPNKLEASRSPLPDNLARLALSWLAARPEFENARAVLKLYDRSAS